MKNKSDVKTMIEFVGLRADDSLTDDGSENKNAEDSKIGTKKKT